MHLLNIEDLERPKLEAIYARNPPYAILSHTWEEEEVTFQEMQNLDDRVRKKAGYRKIIGCCKLALSQSHKYIWIDTCCIDKSSSAELSEAINSMFRWYRDAEVCYVFLVDVASPVTDIKQSRWFTRGWTLQELLAPGHMEFFTAEWEYLGTKLSLREELSEATGIECRALEGANLSNFCVARKMFWASKRNTTRVEDMAYCLLGIFDINMTLLYGEGQKAFVRLQSEIMKTVRDHTLFVWNRAIGKGGGPGLLASSPHYFRQADMVVPIPNSHPRPYHTTNNGVRLELPHSKSISGRFHVALSCHKIFLTGRGTVERKRIWLELLPSNDGLGSNRQYSVNRYAFGRDTGNEEARKVAPVYILEAWIPAGKILAHKNWLHMAPGICISIAFSDSTYSLVKKHPSSAWDNINFNPHDLWISSKSVTRPNVSSLARLPSDGVSFAVEILGALLFQRNSDTDYLVLFVGYLFEQFLNTQPFEFRLAISKYDEVSELRRLAVTTFASETWIEEDNQLSMERNVRVLHNKSSRGVEYHARLQLGAES